MKKNAKRTVVVIALIALLAIPSMFAYFTDVTETLKNTFTIGNVDITLTEPNWTSTGKAEAEAGVVVNQIIDKDPTVTNVGSNDAYVFVEVERDAAILEIVDLSGDWKVLSTEGNKTVYYYAKGATTDTLVALADGEVSSLFTKVKVITNEESKTNQAASTTDINVTAYAIQTTDLDLEEAEVTPSNVWAKVNP